MENPFDDKFFNSVNKSLNALDEAAKKQAHDSQYTADGVLLEEGLKVWCIDLPFGTLPWKLWYKNKTDNSWYMTHDGPGGGCMKRHAKFRVIYADKKNAAFARMKKLNKRIDDIKKKEIDPRAKEMVELGKIFLDEK